MCSSQHLPTSDSQIGITIFSMTDFCFSVAPARLQPKETVTWSNSLINSPAVFSLLEKRVLYFLSLQIKYRFIDKGLDAPEAWKDLCFELTDRDLGVIGGKTHVLQTYEALSELGEKFMPRKSSSSMVECIGLILLCTTQKRSDTKYVCLQS